MPRCYKSTTESGFEGKDLLIGSLYLNAALAISIPLHEASAFYLHQLHVLHSPDSASLNHAQAFPTNAFTVREFSPRISFLTRHEIRTSYSAYSTSCTTHSGPIRSKPRLQWLH